MTLYVIYYYLLNDMYNFNKYILSTMLNNLQDSPFLDESHESPDKGLTIYETMSQAPSPSHI